MRLRGNENGKKRMRRCRKGEDRISHLPDDILISIISRLTTREATATSVLSIRWRSLCAHATRIDFPQLPHKHNSRKQPRDIEASTIDHVLASHGGVKVKEFRVVDICSSNEGKANIDKWLEFAVAKEAESIYIGLLGGRDNPLPHSSTIFDHHNGECLKELSLSGIDVDDRALVLLVRSFPLLESLSVSGTRALRNVSLVGHPTSKLKHLCIGCSSRVESVTIDGLVNLVSLECYGWMKRDSPTLNNVPKLIEFRTSDICFYTMADAMSAMSSVRHQLRTLNLCWNFFISSAYDELDPVQYIGIRNLELTFFLYEEAEGIGFGKPLSLIQACTSLEKLEIKVSRRWSRKEIARVTTQDIFISWDRLPKLMLSPNLKKVKFSGFGGSSSEVELASRIIKNVKGLEELVVEVCDEDKRIRALAIDRARKHFKPTILYRFNFKYHFIVS